MKKTILAIVVCEQNIKRIKNQINNLMFYNNDNNLPYFFFGNTCSTETRDILKDYNVINLPVEEKYIFHSIKTLELLKWLSKIDFSHVVKIDDDTLLNTNLLKNIEGDYIGRFINSHQNSFITINLEKYCIHKRINHFSRLFNFPFKFATGDCYILSKQAVKLAVEKSINNKPTISELPFINEDEYVGFLLSSFSELIKKDITLRTDFTETNLLQVTDNYMSVHPIDETIFDSLIGKNKDEINNIISKNSLRNLGKRKLYIDNLEKNILKTIEDFLNAPKSIGIG